MNTIEQIQYKIKYLENVVSRSNSQIKELKELKLTAERIDKHLKNTPFNNEAASVNLSYSTAKTPQVKKKRKYTVNPERYKQKKTCRRTDNLRENVIKVLKQAKEGLTCDQITNKIFATTRRDKWDAVDYCLRSTPGIYSQKLFNRHRPAYWFYK